MADPGQSEGRERIAGLLARELAAHKVDVASLPAPFLEALGALILYTSAGSGELERTHVSDAALVVAAAMSAIQLEPDSLSLDRRDELKRVAAAVLPMMRAFGLPYLLRLDDV
ncbi:MAG TPA: hypothetical protein VK043_10275 [Burkholderiales bacterium]|nr:hypothetical protein [Burkholderiales bacterium]